MYEIQRISRPFSHSPAMWTPGVMASSVRENNPGSFEQFAGRPDPQGIVACFASQEVTQMVMPGEYEPKCTGVVTEEVITRFCRVHKELIPFASISRGRYPYEDQARYAVEDLGMKGFRLLLSCQLFTPTIRHFSPFLITYNLNIENIIIFFFETVLKTGCAGPFFSRRQY